MIEVTVRVPVLDKATAEAQLRDAGFDVVRSAKPRAKGTPVTSEPNRFQRATALLDMPPGLTGWERAAYVRGYALGITSYHRRNKVGSLGTDWGQVRRNSRTLEWDRHPDAHKAGVKELERARAHRAAYEADRARRQQVAA